MHDHSVQKMKLYTSSHQHNYSMNKKRGIDNNLDLVTFQSEKEVKKPRRSNNSYVKQLANVFTSEELKILIADARKHVIVGEAKHGDDSSKRFCFNALASYSGLGQSALTHVDKLFVGPTWTELDHQVRETVMKGIRLAIRESNLGIRELFVCFELIYIPFEGKKSIPGLIWHSDEGYHTKTEEPFCYANSTTVFMLSDPESWQGGNLQLRKEQNFLGTFKYEHNGAITFINKGTEHRVTRIRPRKQDAARIVLIVSVYGQEETVEYLNALKLCAKAMR
jgi:hypothetical protein